MAGPISTDLNLGKTYNLKFTLSDGNVIDAGEFIVPQGEKGDKGDSATIDANTLIALLSGSNGIAIAKNAAGDKVEVKIPNEITISNSLGTAKLSPQTISLLYNSENVSFLIDAIAAGIYKTKGSEQQWYLHQGNVKTLFGNQQSIYGSGNIDLYRHTVRFTKSGNIDMILSFVSSKNTVIDSLTDLFNAGLPAFYPASGKIKSGGNWYPVFGFETYSSGGILFTSLTGGSGVVWSDISSGLTITDTVTTV